MSVRIAPGNFTGHPGGAGHPSGAGYSSARVSSPAPCLRPTVSHRQARPLLIGTDDTGVTGSRNARDDGEFRRAERSPRRRRHTREAWRRPASPNPAYREVYGRPGCRPERRRSTRLRAGRPERSRQDDTLVLRLLFAAVIAAMCAVPLWGLVFAPSVGGADPAAPASVGVVTVNHGESLSDVARRVAPALPVDAAVASIRELNGLNNSMVRPGQSLVAPVSPCSHACSEDTAQ